MAKTSKCPIFWVHGNTRQCRQTWNGIVEHVTKQGGKPDIQIMFGGFNAIAATGAQRWSTADDVIFALRNRSFCEGPRITKVCGLPESYTDLADWFHIINGSNVLVIQSQFGHIKIGTKQFATAKTSKLFKKVKSEGYLIEHPIVVKNENDAIDLITTVVSEFKKEIKRAVAREIVAKEGKNLDTLENAVIKLCSYQKRKEITIEDVHACCISGFQPETVWQFLEDLDYKRDERALAYLQAFYAEGDGAVGESFYGRVSKLFGALKQHFQFLLHAKDICGDRELNAQLMEDVLVNFKKTTPSKILELQRKKITYDDLEPIFSKKFIGYNIKKDSIRRAFQKQKSEIYRINLALYECMFLCRKHSGKDDYLRLCLDVFALVACGKLTYQEARQIHGKV